MSKDKEAKARDSELKDVEAEESNKYKEAFANFSKSVRHVSPLGMRVLVRIIKDSNTSEGGLYLPEGAKESMQESLLVEVIEVASAIDDDTNEEANISGIPANSKILIPKHAGVKVPWDDKLRLVETKDVLAIVEEIALS